MTNELMQYAQGQVVPTRRDREVAQLARNVYNEVRLADMEVQGSFALAGKIMERAVELDGYRQFLAKGDPAINMMLAEIEVTALRQARSIQTRLYNGW